MKNRLCLSKEIYRIDNIKKAVDDISFEINDGEIVGYIGANGAGKSTTIKMMTGILTPSSGRIIVDGVILLPKIHFNN